MVTHTGIEQPAAEATAACGGNRKPEQAQRSQKASPAQGAQPDAVTASRSPASASRGAKQPCGLFLGRGRWTGGSLNVVLGFLTKIR